MLKSSSIQRNVFLDPKLAQADFDALYGITGHKRHVLPGNNTTNSAAATLSPSASQTAPATQSQQSQQSQTSVSPPTFTQPRVHTRADTSSDTDDDDDDDEKMAASAMKSIVSPILCPIYISGLVNYQ